MSLDREERRKYQQAYRASRSQGRSPGRPPLEDRRVHLSCRLKSSLVGRLQRLLLEGIAHGTFPWKTQSHQIEDLLIRGLEAMRGHESVDEALQYVRAVSHSEAISRHRREAQAAYSTVKTELKELASIGAIDQALHYFWATYSQFEEMSPNVWRDWFLDKMQTDHPDLYARRPKGVSLEPARKRAQDDAEPSRGAVVRMARR